MLNGPLKLILSSFLFFAFVLFVPAFSQGYYYEIRYGANAIINTFTWHILLAASIIVSVYYILFSKMKAVTLLFFCCNRDPFGLDYWLIGLMVDERFGIRFVIDDDGVIPATIRSVLSAAVSASSPPDACWNG